MSDSVQTASSLSNTSGSSGNTIKTEIKTIKITKSSTDDFGFNIIGGTPNEHAIFISRVRNADLENKISEGDRIISVNGTSMEAITLDEAVKIFNQLEGECEFKIEKNAFASLHLNDTQKYSPLTEIAFYIVGAAALSLIAYIGYNRIKKGNWWK